VIFGDEVTPYVYNSIGNLMKDDPNLKEEMDTLNRSDKQLSLILFNFGLIFSY
jgi:hypothetical protein